MIVCLLLFMVGDKTFYYGALAYSSLVLVLFLLRSVSHFMFDTSGSYGSDEGRKRKLILVAFVVITQPLIMWWLTRSIGNSKIWMSGYTDRHSGHPDQQNVASNYDYDKFGLAQLALSKMTGGSGGKAKQFMTNDGEIDYEALLKMPKDDFEGM
ncbi:hypothetical protein GCK72_020408 [Caenorhabditis remanei]|uniref:Protein YIF1 n=1 Tax=Caenorhabditis remanei TaxID=31234 RepID=A0A6A5GGW6_CAERE|nr:hypothetical protein GCK72_020408 [Caenorhabditis remanei]KAF1753851.1 hypothetical protein GCK72_020408 [Caenorhabditis remanei]